MHRISISLGLCAALAAPIASADTKTVFIKSVGLMGQFEPAELTVTAGTAVTFHNEDGSNHIVKFKDGQGPRLRHGASYTRSFEQPGEYPYDCAIHGARMSGKIVVTAP